MPNINNEVFRRMLILKNKWKTVTKSERTIKPKKKSIQKLGFVFLVITEPKPIMENDNKITLIKKIIIWAKNIKIIFLSF